MLVSFFGAQTAMNLYMKQVGHEGEIPRSSGGFFTPHCTNKLRKGVLQLQAAKRPQRPGEELKISYAVPTARSYFRRVLGQSLCPVKRAAEAISKDISHKQLQVFQHPLPSPPSSS